MKTRITLTRSFDNEVDRVRKVPCHCSPDALVDFLINLWRLGQPADEGMNVVSEALTEIHGLALVPYARLVICLGVRRCVLSPATRFTRPEVVADRPLRPRGTARRTYATHDDRGAVPCRPQASEFS